MQKTSVSNTLTRVQGHKAPTAPSRRSPLIPALPALAILLASQLATAAPAFKPEVTVTDALLKARNSKTWKQHPYFEDKGSQYLVAARRPDGAVAILTRSINGPAPKDITVVGYFMKCGVRKDWTFFFPNAAAFNAALTHPSVDDPTEGSDLVEESANEMLYQTVCGKNL